MSFFFFFGDYVQAKWHEAAWEMALVLKSLLWRQKDLSSDPSTYAGLGLVMHDSIHCCGGRNWSILGNHWPVTLAEWMSSRFS